MSKSIATFTQGNTLPAHLQTGTGLGNENVNSDNLTIPTLNLIQQLSPQLKKSDARYIEGAEVGQIFDSLSGQVFDNVFLINLSFETTYSIFKKREMGGGFEGQFDSKVAAEKHMEDARLDPAQYDVVESGVHKCLMLDEDGNPKQPVMIYMSGTKMKVSNQWNTAIQLEGRGADRFATVWTLSSVEETNKRSQSYFNFKISFAGFANKELYDEAKKNYFALTGKAAEAA